MLPSAMHDWFHVHLQITADVQNSDSLWAVHFVSRQADQICMLRKVGDIHGTRCLSSITVEQDVVPPEQVCDTGDVLNCPNLVIDRHYGDKQNSCIQHFVERIYIDESMAVHWYGFDSEFRTIREYSGCG